MVKHLWRRVQMLMTFLHYMVSDEWFAYVFWRQMPNDPDGRMVVGFHSLAVPREDCEHVATAVSEALARLQSLRQGRLVVPEKL